MVLVIVMIVVIMTMVVVVFLVVVDMDRIRGMPMTMAVVVELGGEPGHGQTQNECTAQDHSIVTVELKFRQKIAERDAEEHAHGEPQCWRHPDRSELPRPYPHHHANAHTQWSDEGEQDIGDDPGSNGTAGGCHDGDETQGIERLVEDDGQHEGQSRDRLLIQAPVHHGGRQRDAGSQTMK